MILSTRPVFKKILLIYLAIMLILFNLNIFQKEQIKTKGKTFYAELRPKDPRALMMGDYMALAFMIDSHTVFNDNKPPTLVNLWIDQQKIIYTDKMKNTIMQQVSNSNNQLNAFPLLMNGKMKPNRYYFPEGQAEIFEMAKYGIFKYLNSKEYLLVGLADANLKPLIWKK